jgi:hypothetical protein
VECFANKVFLCLNYVLLVLTLLDQLIQPTLLLDLDSPHHAPSVTLVTTVQLKACPLQLNVELDFSLLKDQLNASLAMLVIFVTLQLTLRATWKQLFVMVLNAWSMPFMKQQLARPVIIVMKTNSNLYHAQLEPIRIQLSHRTQFQLVPMPLLVITMMKLVKSMLKY